MITYSSAKKEFVVDASFVLRALFQKSSTAHQRFLEILSSSKKISVLAPTFLHIEVRNALRFSTEDFSILQESLDSFDSLPIHFTEPNSFLLNQATYTSLKTNTTVYDSLYHVFALQKKSTFLTCDKKYYQAAKSLGFIELVE